MKTLKINNRVVKEFQNSIISWYAVNGRDFPWRNSNDPFKIIIAEVLLQKTDTEKVNAVFEKFINLWPSPKILSEASVSDILEIIQPLGLRYKASRLKSIAETIVRDFNGEVPESEDKLIELHGVGKYIASAVECFAFNKPKAVLDTNVIRILTRVFDIKTDKNRARDDLYLWDIAQKLTPVENIKCYNCGIIDYGALICRSKKPLCNNCVINHICISYRLSTKELKCEEVNEKNYL